jgi:YfiH family protein
MPSPTPPPMTENTDWIVPEWPVPQGVRALCTTRSGGVSDGPYASLNLGDHVADVPSAVSVNRATLRERIGARPVFLRQVHGTAVAMIDDETPDGTDADACVTPAAGVACTIMVADCLPVLFSTDDGSLVGAAHAGWRGLANGVLEATVARMADEAGLAPSRLLAWMGPCIGPSAFEVGPEVKAAFEQHRAAAGRHFRAAREGKWHADLPALARERLAEFGVDKVFGNDGGTAWCTVSDSSRFFSHRRDGVSGRFAACIWRI